MASSKGGFNSVVSICHGRDTWRIKVHVLRMWEMCPIADPGNPFAVQLVLMDVEDEPRKMSIYREEAIDTLISCLGNTDFPATQLAAAETIMSLQRRFSFSEKPLIREILLKQADTDKSSISFVPLDQMSPEI